MYFTNSIVHLCRFLKAHLWVLCFVYAAWLNSQVMRENDDPVSSQRSSQQSGCMSEKFQMDGALHELSVQTLAGSGLDQ